MAIVEFENVTRIYTAGDHKLSLCLGPLTYTASIARTLGVSLLVSRMVAGKNRKIDMVEALKGAE